MPRPPRLPYYCSEDKLIKKYYKTKTAKEIGLMLGRSQESVYHRFKKLGLKAHKKGQYHHHSKISDNQAIKIRFLSDSGLTSVQIHKYYSKKLFLSYQQTLDICAGRSRIIA